MGVEKNATTELKIHLPSRVRQRLKAVLFSSVVLPFACVGMFVAARTSALRAASRRLSTVSQRAAGLGSRCGWYCTTTPLFWAWFRLAPSGRYCTAPGLP